MFLILHAAFEIKAGEILKYLYVRICQFGKNFNNKIMANFAGAIMIWKAQRSHNLTELDFFTEFLWLYLTNHDKEHGYIVIHQLKTLPKSSEELLEHSANMAKAYKYEKPAFKYLMLERVKLGTNMMEAIDDHNLSFIITKIR